MNDDSDQSWNQPSRHAIPETLGEDGGEDQNPKRRELIAKAKLPSLKHLIQSLDTIVYTEIFILYYMDCSFFRLLIRSLSQLVLFTPTAGTPILNERPYMSGLLLPNLLCIILHLFTARPEVGEVMRGYLHGGVIMDFIGQKGPTSKPHLILIDILIIALQCLMVAVNTEYKTLHFYIKDKEYENPALPAPVPGMDPPRSQQDHDAEERGILRVAGTSQNDDIELNDLSPPENINLNEGAAAEEQRGLLGDHLLHDPRSREDELEEWLNLHNAGIAVTAEFHILDTLRRQYQPYKTRAEMIRATEAVLAGETGRGSRLASVSDILSRAMERDGQIGE